MTATFPDGVLGQGTMRVQIVDAIANVEAPKITELNAGVDVTPYFPASAFSIGHSQSRVDDTRLSDKATRESFGRSTYTVETPGIIYYPQGDPSLNKAYDAMVPGTTKFLVVRYGIDSDNTFAAGEKVDVYDISFGDRVKNTPAGDEGAKHTFTPQVSLTLLEEDVATVAGP